MDVDRRRDTPRSGSKDLITHGKNSSQSISICTGFLNPRCHRETQRKPGDSVITVRMVEEEPGP